MGRCEQDLISPAVLRYPSRSVSTADAYMPSSRMRGAALAERARIERELGRLQSRHDHLLAELAAVDAAQRDLADQVRALNRLVHDVEDAEPTNNRGPRSPGLANGHTIRQRHAVNGHEPENGRALLRGSQIREMAVRVLASSREASQPLHYRDLYALLFARGFSISGKDPFATFLTQLTRSPALRRGPEPGTYVLDYHASRRIQQELGRLVSELDQMHREGTPANVELLESVRLRRRDIAAAIKQKQRELEEVLRSLGDEPEQVSA